MKTVDTFSATVMNIDNHLGTFGFAHIDGKPKGENVFFHHNCGHEVCHNESDFWINDGYNSEPPRMPRRYDRIVIAELTTSNKGVAATKWCHQKDLDAARFMHLLSSDSTTTAPQGKVKFFNENSHSGWGFIVMDDSDTDLFFELNRGVQIVAGDQQPELDTSAFLPPPQTGDRLMVFHQEHDAHSRSKAALWCYQEDWQTAVDRIANRQTYRLHVQRSRRLRGTKNQRPILLCMSYLQKDFAEAIRHFMDANNIRGLTLADIDAHSHTKNEISYRFYFEIENGDKWGKCFNPFAPIEHEQPERQLALA